jgi:ATP-dependent HslUV protease subunit HslV
MHKAAPWYGTTVLTVRHRGKVALGADGQVTHGSVVVKPNAVKIRKLAEGSVLVGFAGATADAMALLERFEAKLKNFPGNIVRAAVELAKEWRTERALRQLEAMMTVVDRTTSLLLTGSGDVLEPADGVIAIGSGGPMAAAAARALLRHSSLSATEIVREALRIAAELDVYTNEQILVEELEERS